MEASKIILFLILSCLTFCHAKVEGGAESNQLEKASNSTVLVEKSPYITSVQSTIWPTDLTWRSGVGQALVIGGAAIFSFFLIGAMTMFLAPALGYRMCGILGNCEPTVTAYSSSGGTLQNAGQPNAAYTDVYSAYLPATAYAGYQKRSLDYVGPILKTLASAYEKYEEKHAPKIE